MFVKADMEAEARKMQKMIDADPELKQFANELDSEFELREKMTQARKAAGLTQKQLSMLSGLNRQAISRAESDSDISPNLRTLVKYLNALGYKLDVVKIASK
jgi:DNA-binding XRE family transcriptional regulator